MPVLASLYLWVAFLIIVVPMIACDYPELFKHNVELEFAADDIYELKNRIRARVKFNKMVLKAQKNKEDRTGSKKDIELSQ